MPRRHRGHPGETEPPENADHEGPAPADLLQMWITGRQPQIAATPETPPEPELVAPDHPDHRGDPVADEDTWTDAVDLPWTETDDDTPVEDEPEEAPDGPEPVAEVADVPVPVAEAAPEPDPAPDPAPEPDTSVLTARQAAEEQAQGWASFGHARTAEDVLERSDRNPWLDVLLGGTTTPPHPPAEPAKPALLRELDHDEEPTESADPAYDPDATAIWTLEDFDTYVRAQSGAELTDWVAGVREDADEVTGEDTDEVTDPGRHDDLGTHVAAVEVVTDPVPDSADAGAHAAPAPGTVAEPRQRVRGLLARMGLHTDAHHEEDGTAGLLEAETAGSEPEPIPELASIPVPEPQPDPEPAPITAPLTEAPADPVDLGWPEEPDDAWSDAPLPVGGLAAYTARWGSAEDWQTDDWEPDRWQSAEPPVAEDPPALEVAAPPEESTPEEAAPEPVDVVAEPVTPAQPTLFEEQVTEPDLRVDPDSTQDFDWTAIEHAQAAPVQDAAAVEYVPAREEWYDGAGTLWTSDDGGQTWYTDDGRGWNAETYEDIAPSDARHTRPAATSEPEPEADVDLEVDPGAGAEPSAPEQPQPEGRLGVPARVAAAALGVDNTTTEDDDGPVIPHHVEYKPRASYRPLLGILFVVAAVLAVVAIFWAVSQGGQSSIGIAIGVTGFALAFWWGLLSWTPTVVSLNGPILEVARGADGERFDLRDPDLDIDVDDDTASRNWRATITRPNDTELVIPASAVDPDEFTTIVQHYRGEVEREDHPSR